TIGGLFGGEAPDQTVPAQALLDPAQCGLDPLILDRQKAQQRRHQQAGVGATLLIALAECATLRVDALGTDIRMDLVAQRAPAFQWCAQGKSLGIADRSIDRDPGVDLRVGVVAPTVAQLPDTVVGLAPAASQFVHQLTLTLPGLATGLQTAASQ